MQDAKEPDIKLQKPAIARLFRTAPQEHRKPDAPTVELSFMEQHRSLQGGNRDGHRPRLSRRKRCCGPRLIMIFNEPHESLLIAGVSAEMKPDGFGVVV